MKKKLKSVDKVENDSNNHSEDTDEISERELDTVSDISKLYRVLLIQPHKGVSSSLYQIILEHLPECHIDCASSLKDAMDYVKVLVPDCIILDIALGNEVCLTLCRHWKTTIKTSKTPILLVINNDIATQRRWEYLAAGVDDFLVFPCDITELITRVRILLKIKQTEVVLWDTSRKLMNLAEERSRALFVYDELNRFLLDNCSNPILIFELNKNIEDSRFLNGNSIVYRMTGYTKDEFLQLRLRDIIPKNRMEGVQGRIESIIQHQQVSFETVILAKDGRQIPIYVQARVFDTDNQPCIIAIGQPLEDTQSITSERLSESISRYRILAAQTGMMIYDCNLQTGKIKWGGAVTQVTGYLPRELDMIDFQRWVDHIHPEDLPRVQAHIAIAREEVGKFRIEYRLMHKSGEYRYIENQGVVLPDANGEAYRILGSIKDITAQKQEEEERRRAEQQIQHSQRLESLGVLAGGIAHDFNNLLAVIIGLTDMALNEVPKKTPLHDDLKEVLQAAHRAKDLVKQILTFSRQTGEERSPLYLHVIAREALKLLRATTPPSIEIIDNIDVHSGAIMGNPAQIHQVVMNYCTNAIQAMPKGGKLEVDIRDVVLDNSASSIHPKLKPGTYVKLTVRDNGHGMEPQILERIFDPFFTTKKPGEGTGMGLAVVHGIVSAHGGAIIVESKPGMGSTFYTYFPRIDHPIVSEQKSDEEPLEGHERILFVDDEESVCKLGKRVLTQWGYEVEACQNPLSALAIFTQAPDRFDLVVTDQAMPKMSGEVLARWVKELRPEIPVILFTGFSGELSPDELKRLGIDEIVMKPIVARDLAQRIRKVLDQQKKKS
ncbi:MAG TPA: response regulator [Candidatus Hydrogenedens sp.]|nr:response regulator [Candidatus Hydrogenedens sp.]HOL19478.1 response regulator [Candidatus Hydrogenedens sp.]HPP59418.1 response regulator [Candidatus Hydrogenedens sp.]